MEREEFFKQSCEVMLNLKGNHNVLFFVNGKSHHLTLNLHVDFDEIISASTCSKDHEEQLAKIRRIVGLEPKKEGE